MSDIPNNHKSVTVPDFLSARSRGAKLTMLTAYDYTSARLLDAAGVDSILVGDSLGMVIQGQANILTVTLDEVIYHTRCVSRGVRRALLVADMPFMSYQISPEQALANAGRLIQEGGAHAVKLEGGKRMAGTVAKIAYADIPVIGHIGLTPQSVHRFGGFRVQRDMEQLLEDAHAIAQAGAFAIVLECIPADIATQITEQLSIPTIGIGAGAGCDGQVLVMQDMLGMFEELHPKFVKRYAELGKSVVTAVQRYCQEVQCRGFPGPEHEFK
ncbi:MAG TPA: 3-methyl-2-oxobutanoate hydroxymethyltransferase [Gemmataceae bacterium]|nr:3-methyl-2-oxobutanoate hydroxymethyltransferase [Gemmataceae bacterium]